MNGANSDRVMHEPNGQTNTPTTHSITSQDRRAITVRGVREVISFDDGGVDLLTVCGRLTLEGEGLRVTVLNTKDCIVEVTGKLCGLLYEDIDVQDSKSERRGRRSRFFHS